MLREETLNKTDRRTYEEPDGEFLELIGTGTNTVTVLTRVDSEKGAVESPPIDPEQLTVTEMKEALEDGSYDWNQPALRGLLGAEQDGKNRTTAVKAIEEKLR